MEMKIIKFRGWDNKSKKMGKCFSLDNASYEGFPFPFTDENGDCDTCADYTVMQFTGLLDKNGKDIYDGDIIKWGFTGENIGIIEWDNKNFEYCITLNKRLFESPNGLKDFWSDRIEVIGNIYENPELLK
jgi:uncharacterized phage protein (TIGR01671 family)